MIGGGIKSFRREAISSLGRVVGLLLTSSRFRSCQISVVSYQEKRKHQKKRVENDGIKQMHSLRDSLTHFGVCFSRFARIRLILLQTVVCRTGVGLEGIFVHQGLSQLPAGRGCDWKRTMERMVERKKKKLCDQQGGQTLPPNYENDLSSNGAKPMEKVVLLHCFSHVEKTTCLRIQQDVC